VSSGGGSDGGGGAINAQGLGEDNNVDWSTSMSSLCMDEFSTIIIPEPLVSLSSRFWSRLSSNALIAIQSSSTRKVYVVNLKVAFNTINQTKPPFSNRKTFK
jgi:hypothetical protein